MTVKDAMEVYWRVRKWDISISAGYYDSNGMQGGGYSVFYPNSYIGSFQKDYTFDGNFFQTPNPSGLPPQNEEALVCNPRYLFNPSGGEEGIYTAENWGPYDQAPFDRQDGAFLAVSSAFNQGGAGIGIEHIPTGFYDSASDLFYPRFSQWFGRWVGGSYQYYPFPFSGSKPAGTLTYVLSDSVVSIPLYFDTFEGGLASAYLDVSYTAKEWWSYDGTYDTTTGQPL